MFTWNYEDIEGTITREQLLSQAANLGLTAEVKSQKDEYDTVTWTVLIKSETDTDACSFHDVMTSQGHRGLLREGGFRQ